MVVAKTLAMDSDMLVAKKFGDFIRDARISLGWSQDHLAAQSSLSRSLIQKIELKTKPDGLRELSLFGLAKAFSLLPEQLLEKWKRDESSSFSSPPIPVIGNIQAGGLIENFDSRHADENEFIPCPIPGAPDAFARCIVGDSMSPRFLPGDRVVFHPVSCDELKDGDDAMIQLDGSGDSESTFKRVYRQGKDKLLLVPINNGQKPFVVNCNQVIRAARAVAIYRPL